MSAVTIEDLFDAQRTPDTMPVAEIVRVVDNTSDAVERAGWQRPRRAHPDCQPQQISHRGAETS